MLFICDYCATYHIRISTCTYSNFKENEIWTKYTRRGSRESYEKDRNANNGWIDILISIIITSAHCYILRRQIQSNHFVIICNNWFRFDWFY